MHTVIIKRNLSGGFRAEICGEIVAFRVIYADTYPHLGLFVSRDLFRIEEYISDYRRGVECSEKIDIPVHHRSSVLVLFCVSAVGPDNTYG